MKGGANKKAPLVITAIFGHYRTFCFFVDAGATFGIMYRQCFDMLEEDDKHRLVPVNAPITSFKQSVEYSLGQLTFPVMQNDRKHSRTEDVDFLVMEIPHPNYDIILGRESIGDFNTNPSSTHRILGVPNPTGVAIIYANRECHVADTSAPPRKTIKASCHVEPEKWVLYCKFPEQTITIEPTLSKPTRLVLKRLLLNNMCVSVCSGEREIWVGKFLQ